LSSVWHRCDEVLNIAAAYFVWIERKKTRERYGLAISLLQSCFVYTDWIVQTVVTYLPDKISGYLTTYYEIAVISWRPDLQ
jgi:hypothetical protein